jgi:methyl-accepting chemotaxis protein
LISGNYNFIRSSAVIMTQTARVSSSLDSQKYAVARKAYLSKDYLTSSRILDLLVRDANCSPKAHLLRGHVYAYGFNDYKTAKIEYEWILLYCTELDIVSSAIKGIEDISNFSNLAGADDTKFNSTSWNEPSNYDLKQISDIFNGVGETDIKAFYKSSNLSTPYMEHQLTTGVKNQPIDQNFSIADTLTIEKSEALEDISYNRINPTLEFEARFRESCARPRSFIKISPKQKIPLFKRIIQFFKHKIDLFDTAPIHRKPLIGAIYIGLATCSVVLLACVLSLACLKANNKFYQRYIEIGLIGAGSSSLAGALIGYTLLKKLCFETKVFIRELSEEIETVNENENVHQNISSRGEYFVALKEFNHAKDTIISQKNAINSSIEGFTTTREDLESQVLSLLKEIEKIRFGDLTIELEVTANVLGSVADSFNLTFGALHGLVKDVKLSVTEFQQIAALDKNFAQHLTIDAAKKSRVLATTVNTIQAISGSIQRVKFNAIQAQEVAWIASNTAQAGFDAVNLITQNIQEILETVANSNRKMKSLAESSQHISEIIAVVSQISTRTNLLALNASIEASRAGSSGQGFSIVANEIRQLADKSAIAVKSIQVIVADIQVETKSVMAAMEGGIAQVSKGTKLAQEANESLVDILSVTSRISELVNSMTVDTLEQSKIASQISIVVTSAETASRVTAKESQQVFRSLEEIGDIANQLSERTKGFITN